MPAAVNRKFAGDTPAATAAFTLIELLVVMAIIIVLAGLVLSTVGYVQKKGARSRAETEIAAMSAACESYKADNGIYPRDATTTRYPRMRGKTTDATADGISAMPVLYLYDIVYLVRQAEAALPTLEQGPISHSSQSA